MKQFLSVIVGMVLLATGLEAATESVPTYSEWKKTAEGFENTGAMPELGTGFDTKTKQLKEACIEGKPEARATAIASVGGLETLSRGGDKVLPRLNYSPLLVPGTPAAAMAAAIGKFEMENIALSLYEYRMAGQRESLRDAVLTQTGKKALAQKKWRQVCGDHFISSRERGSRFQVVIKFKFKDITPEFFQLNYLQGDKSFYKAAGLASIAGWKPLLRADTGEVVSHPSLEAHLLILQDGGQTDLLAKALEVTPQDGLIQAKCDNQTLKHCVALAHQAIQYASSATYSDQLKDEKNLAVTALTSEPNEEGKF